MGNRVAHRLLIGSQQGSRFMQHHLANWLIQRHQQAVLHKPDHPKAWSKLYSICTQENKSAEFLQFCEDIIRVHPGNRHAWTFLQLASKEETSAVDLLALSKEIVRLH